MVKIDFSTVLEESGNHVCSYLSEDAEFVVGKYFDEIDINHYRSLRGLSLHIFVLRWTIKTTSINF